MKKISLLPVSSWLLLASSIVLLLPLPHAIAIILAGVGISGLAIGMIRTWHVCVVAVILMLAFVVPLPFPSQVSTLLKLLSIVGFWSIIMIISLVKLNRRLSDQLNHPRV